MAGQLQLELERLTNQARFIAMIVNKELTVSGRKKVDIVAELRKRDFRPFPKIAKAKAAGETEDVVEEDEDEDEEEKLGKGINDYDYLLQMAISSLTKEKVRKTLSFMATLLTVLCRSRGSRNRRLIRKPNCWRYSN